MIDFTLVVDLALTGVECQKIINSSNITGLSSQHLEGHMGYRHLDLDMEDLGLSQLSSDLLDQYRSQFPSLDYMDNALAFSPWRFKHFPPTYSYDRWHSEHNLAVAHRVLCIIVYLSDNDCGTEFLHDGTVIKSVMGRAVVFPTFWTHTHRGQRDPAGKDRYIMSTYAHYVPTNSDWIKNNPLRTGKIVLD
jgi:hypothetical protein